METTLLQVTAVILVLAGLIGTVLPVLPGTLLVFGGLWLAAYADRFAHVGTVGLAIIAVLGALSFAADFVASLAGAKRVGASPLALMGAAVGGFAGFFFGIPGLLLGPFAGAAAGELVARRNLRRAGKVGLGTWLGLLVAAVLKVVIAVLMVATYFAFYALG